MHKKSKTSFHSLFINLIGILLLVLLYFDAISERHYGGDGDRTIYQTILVIITLLLLFYFLLNVKSKINTIILILIILSTYILISNFQHIISNDTFKFMFWAYSLLFFLLAFFTYNITKQSDKLGRQFKKYTYPLFAFSIFTSYLGFIFYQTRYNIVLAPGIYTSLVFLPWIQIQKNNLFRKIVIAFLAVAVLISLKRGAIIALIIVFIVNEFVDTKIRGRGITTQQLIRSLSIVILVVGGLIFANHYSGGRLQGRFKADQLEDGSGRSDSNKIAMNALLNESDPYSLIFGYSPKTDQLEGFIGHNDWLVLTIWFGLIAFFIFLLFFLFCLKHLIYLMRIKSEIAVPFSTLLILMFLTSLYSTTYSPTVAPIFSMLFLGYALGTTAPNRQTPIKTE